MAAVLYLECSACSRREDASRPASLCPACRRPLLARYDLEPLAALRLGALRERRADQWRYHEVLPLPAGQEPVSLGEGWTPLLRLERLGRELGLAQLWAKNEGVNPTGSFKDRGMSAAFTAARALGLRQFRIPSAGNAASSAAAYSRRSGCELRVAIPAQTPLANKVECRVFGSPLAEVPGSLREAGAYLAEHAPGWFDLSTLREPYRLEGKKTMGYELFEQGGGRLPDVILYPTGGGTGLIGMWKAFAELEQAGHLDHRPRMVCVQARGCAPLVDAFHAGAAEARSVADPQTIAPGLRVPAAIGDRLILKALRESGGTAIAVDDADLLPAALRIARAEGLLVSPEAAATVAALAPLRECGWLAADQRVVLFLTSTGLKNLDFYAPAST